MKTSVRELRATLSGVLNAVDRGETVYVTRRGKVTAKIVRVDEDTGKKKKKEVRNGFIGMWRDREDMKDPTEYVHRLRENRYK